MRKKKFYLLNPNFAADLDEGWTTSRWINFGLNVGPSLIPFIGWEGGVAGRLGINYLTSSGTKNMLMIAGGSRLGIKYSTSSGAKTMATTVTGNSESYVITNMPKWGGGTFTGGYMSTVEYIKYGTNKRVIRTAFGDTGDEAAKNALKYTYLPDRVAYVIDRNGENIDETSYNVYNNISEYLKH
ncbi:hypothetical protein [Methanobacterium sp.]|uniref:hypothetical protein n=1 Tax=Methanobacterium sp. TaxID=2164 RepID=UPI0031585574